MTDQVDDSEAQASSELAQMVAEDTRPFGPDGASNADRVAFILDCFEVDSIDLTEPFDFDAVMGCKVPDLVLAAKHLAVLKLAFLKEAMDVELIDGMDGEVGIAFLTLAIQKLNWHFDHLEAGRRTPPFPSLG